MHFLNRKTSVRTAAPVNLPWENWSLCQGSSAMTLSSLNSSDEILPEIAEFAPESFKVGEQR